MSNAKTIHRTFQAKNGLWYKTYVDMVEANRQANEQYLNEKGLLHFKQNIRQKRTKRTVTKASSFKLSATNKPVRRSSRRIQRIKPENKGLLLLDYDESLSSSKSKMVVKRPKKKTAKNIVQRNIVLSDSDRQILQELPDWIEDMEDWLVTVPHGNGNKIVSRDNANSVMKQVKLLASGTGITYHHWKKGTYFMKNKRVHLGMDFNEIYEKAVEMENKHGRDLGNGWLLRHPIRKLELYQQYKLRRGIV